VKWATFDEINKLFHQGRFMFDDIDELEKVKVFIEKRCMQQRATK